MTADPTVLQILGRALDNLRSDPSSRSLEAALQHAAEWDEEPTPSVSQICGLLENAPPGDPLRLRLQTALGEWDGKEDADWAGNTPHQTFARRQHVYELLDLQPEAKELFERLFPPRLVEDPGFEITQDFERWYTDSVEENGFYWPRYKAHLREAEKWGLAVEDLSRATRQVVERLGRPDREEVAQVRGLVVGYVQSGKTANFMGVMARAIDAGYRLIIVLTGTTNLLRGQTQRRVDKQLIGAEALTSIAADEEYQTAPDWNRFIRYGGRPRDLGGAEIIRLTTSKDDYRRLRGGLAALEFRPSDPSQPLNTRENLSQMPVRLIVMKKNRAPLTSLARDLRDIGAGGVALEQVPALLIDDESDQASINTRRPSKRQIDTRTAINSAITDLLTILPRCQYVGYTATPFANVFVDPNDEIGIYPKDFVLGLDRPNHYMGADRYHDFGEHREGFESNERAYARPVFGDDLADDNLRRAVDLYLLSGAVKLYRAAEGCDLDIEHHTMLVHTSQKTAVHSETAEALRTILSGGGYNGGSARARLRDLLEEDLRPVYEAKGNGLPFPDDYEDLEQYVAECFQKLQDGHAVLIVNGLRENEDLSPDFDRESVWSIIVGGTKLSRGYTIEGLTISYYRRPSRAADTLMQMGRWFGFRRNYEDLMRLFVGRAEGSLRNPLDLYEAFGAVCQDELELRHELSRYSLPSEGEPITPFKVPVLVAQHLPALKPTARNKMWNAELQSQNFGGRQIASTLAPGSKSATRRNESRVKEMMEHVELDTEQLGNHGRSFRALVGSVDSGQMLTFLEEYEWSKPGIMDRLLSFLDGDIGDPGVEGWHVVFPLLRDVGSAGLWAPNESAGVTVVERYRDPDTARFGVYTDPDHVAAANAIVSGEEGDLEQMTDETANLAGAADRGVALMYAVKPKGRTDDPVTIGFSLFPPPNDIPETLKWGVKVEDSDEAVVDSN